MSVKVLTTRDKLALSRAARVVSYLTAEEIYQIAEAAERSLKGDRDYLLILLLFQTGLRISEALALTPRHITQFEGRPVLQVLGKGRKPRLVSCPERLALELRSYAYTHKLNLDDRFFKINRKRAWQITKAASAKAGLTKRVYPHLLRHSDGIERLRQTGNPKALQLHLGHRSMLMTMRYLSTLQ